MRGLVNSAKPLRNLSCRRVNLTNPSSIGTPEPIPYKGLRDAKILLGH